jgi:hypothetical protein
MARDLLKFFDYEHLKDDRLKTVSRQFYDLAMYVDAELPESAESTFALRQLLLAKDAAVRAAL